MRGVRRLASSSLLGLGILPAFVGMRAALVSTGGGMIASVAASAALLYAGCIWFGTPPDTRRSASKPSSCSTGRSGGRGAAPHAALSHFPEPMQAEIGARCRAAPRRAHAFPCASTADGASTSTSRRCRRRAARCSTGLICVPALLLPVFGARHHAGLTIPIPIPNPQSHRYRPISIPQSHNPRAKRDADCGLRIAD